VPGKGLKDVFSFKCLCGQQNASYGLNGPVLRWQSGVVVHFGIL